jgi:hypothetical protein
MQQRKFGRLVYKYEYLSPGAYRHLFPQFATCSPYYLIAMRNTPHDALSAAHGRGRYFRIMQQRNIGI